MDAYDRLTELAVLHGGLTKLSLLLGKDRAFLSTYKSKNQPLSTKLLNELEVKAGFSPAYIRDGVGSAFADNNIGDELEKRFGPKGNIAAGTGLTNNFSELPKDAQLNYIQSQIDLFANEVMDTGKRLDISDAYYDRRISQDNEVYTFSVYFKRAAIKVQKGGSIIPIDTITKKPREFQHLGKAAATPPKDNNDK